MARIMSTVIIMKTIKEISKKNKYNSVDMIHGYKVY